MQYKVSQSWMKSKRIPGCVRAAGIPPAIEGGMLPAGHHLRLAGWLSTAKPPERNQQRRCFRKESSRSHLMIPECGNLDIRFCGLTKIC